MIHTIRCFQVTEWGGTHIDCSFTSMPQCQATASNLGGLLRQSIFPAAYEAAGAERLGGGWLRRVLGPGARSCRRRAVSMVRRATAHGVRLDSAGRCLSPELLRGSEFILEMFQ